MIHKCCEYVKDIGTSPRADHLKAPPALYDIIIFNNYHKMKQVKQAPLQW